MLIFSTLVVTGFLGWSVHPYLFGSTPVMVSDHAVSAQLAVYRVDGMTCGGCELAVDGAIAATGLIDSVKSSFAEGKAYVWLAEPEVNNETILEAIASVGYEASLIQPE
jgi:copper chaperone CopZ